MKRCFPDVLALEVLPARGRRVLASYRFFDPGGQLWLVPKGAVVDGASIPRALWSFIGSPFSGRYVGASVIHDYYCTTRERSWQKTHRAFYDGMRAAGVPRIKAAIMYRAIWLGGPRWKLQEGGEP